MRSSQPGASTLGAQSVSRWTSREAPGHTPEVGEGMSHLDK